MGNKKEISINEKMDAILKLPNSSELSEINRKYIAYFADFYKNCDAEEHLTKKSIEKINFIYDKLCKKG